MRDYELMLISRAELEDEQQQALLEKATGLIAEYGGPSTEPTSGANGILLIPSSTRLTATTRW